MLPKRLHVIFSGRVQGVGFRFTAETIANSLGLAGWVKNLKDGRVEIVVEGRQEHLKDFLARIEEQFSGYIQDRVVSWDKPTGEFHEFGIRF